VSPDVCVVESTYGVQSHQPRREREARFTEVIANTVKRGGRVLIPAFALGRAQVLASVFPPLHSCACRACLSPSALRSTYSMPWLVHRTCVVTRAEHPFPRVDVEVETRGAGIRHHLGPDHVTPFSQELLLILEEYWAAHPELHGVPIYYASPLAKRCMKAYQTYINSMNDKIRQQYDTKNPFVFKHILNLKSLNEFDDNGTPFVGGWIICTGKP
jgi:predicted metal-dependent RNase